LNSPLSPLAMIAKGRPRPSYRTSCHRTPVTIDRKGDIPDIIEHFRKRREEKPKDRKGKCFFVPVEEIKQNNYDLSISRYKEIEYEEVQYEKPGHPRPDRCVGGPD
jgi:N-6 DNA Methylase